MEREKSRCGWAPIFACCVYGASCLGRRETKSCNLLHKQQLLWCSDYCARGGAMFIAVWCICATRKIRNTAPVVVNPHLLGCCSSIARFISRALQQPACLCRRESSTGNYPDLAIYNFELRGAYIITPYVERRAHPQSAPPPPLKGLKCGHGVTMLYSLCSTKISLSGTSGGQ